MAGQSRTPPTDLQIVAFKLGARARKLASEDCIIEGLEMLMTAKAEADKTSPDLAVLLDEQIARFERRWLEGTL